MKTFPSKESLEYYSFREVKRYLEEHGWTKEEIRLIEIFLLDEEDSPYVKFITDETAYEKFDALYLIAKRWTSESLPEDPVFFISWK